MLTGFTSFTRKGILLFPLFFVHFLCAQPPSELLIRIDDIGMNHSVNMALQELAATKMPLSASVMFTCPWYQEAVDILKENPQIAVGIHLTLNSEWKYYRWGPVLGKEAVPSLVDDAGYFIPSGREFLESAYRLEEVERELEAQIQRALASGLKLEYMDYHMRTALATPGLEEVTRKLAEKYQLKRSMFMGEHVVTLFEVPVEEKKVYFLDHLRNELVEDKPNLVILHVAKANPEMKALVDMNNAGQNSVSGDPLVARHRQAELDMLISPEVSDALTKKEIKLITYADLK